MPIRQEASLKDFAFRGFDEINEAVRKLIAGELRELYIVGDYGAGKTHLAMAIDNHYTATTKRSTINLSLKDLLEQDPEATALLGLEMFDLIIIDDLQEVRHSYDWQTGLFDLINKVREQQKQLLFLADNPARELQIGLLDLVTRLSLCPLLTMPSFEHADDRDQLLNTILKNKSLKLPDEVHQHLVQEGPRNAGDMIVVLGHIMPLFTLLKNTRIPKKTINEAKAVIDRETFLLEVTNHGQNN